MTDTRIRDWAGTSTGLNAAGWNAILSVVSEMSLRDSSAWVLNTVMCALCKVHRGLLPKSNSGGWIETKGAHSGPGARSSG